MTARQGNRWMRRLATTWRWVRHFVVMELRLYRALYLAVRRRRHGVRPGTETVGYARMVTPVMGLWIFASALEIPLVHVLTPWHSVRLALVAVGIWGLAWMIGMLVSLRVHPHLLDEEGITVRYGPMVAVPVRWDDLERVEARERDWPSSVRTVQWSEDGDELAVAVSSRTNLVLHLRAPVPVRPTHQTRAVRVVHLWVDEPRDVARDLRARLEARAGSAGRSSTASGNKRRT